eukprot:CAMPEP_0176446848 /NCGR_PEP_ID=MMETSP0127-20121128/24599_1 /TAXON_ID=938130 /ORGANISM="Platyophrya macrostoma, Strain WH" /LENGTH=163 /DNA_ID=CAMNT_0017833019 /DNA_START=56 /DNA_END=547 /DNA_ORIENTATION=+
MSDEEPEMRSFKDARADAQDRMKILRRYIKKKKPTTKESKISKDIEPVVNESNTSAAKIKVEPTLLHKVNEALPSDALKEYVKNRKLTKIGFNAEGFQGTKIVLKKDPVLAKKTIGNMQITYVNNSKFIPPTMSQEANSFERSALFRNANRRAPLAIILKKSS